MLKIKELIKELENNKEQTVVSIDYIIEKLNEILGGKE
jgi:hypothetical protein